MNSVVLLDHVFLEGSIRQDIVVHISVGTNVAQHVGRCSEVLASCVLQPTGEFQQCGYLSEYCFSNFVYIQPTLNFLVH